MAEKRGRPTLFTKQLKEIACRLAQEKGSTVASIAAKLGIGQRTLFLYLQQDKDFLHNFKAAQDLADDLVEISLWRIANGYTHAEEKIFYDSDRGKVVRAKTLKHYPPNQKAIALWLTNRRPESWREKPLEDAGDSDKPIKIAVDEQDL